MFIPNDVRLAVFLEREEPWERYGPPIVPVEAQSHRPKKRFKVRLESEEDVERAQRQGLPIFLVRSEDLKILRYPLRIPPTILVPREYVGVLETSLPVRTFQSRLPFERPRIEDVVVFLLMHDPLAARAVVERNRDLLDLSYLTKRIYQENLEEQATLVRLQDHMNIPVVGAALRREALMRAVRANRVTEVLP